MHMQAEPGRLKGARGEQKEAQAPQHCRFVGLEAGGTASNAFT
jgi:hypothetical protein